MSNLQVTYRVEAPADQIDAVAESILLEQTVETPRSVAERNSFVRDNLLGEILQIDQVNDASFHVVCAIPDINALLGPAQLLNVLFGNASLHPHVSLEDFSLPQTVLQQYPGPRFGIEGIRKALNVFDRPLTFTALKPVGLSPSEMAALCSTFAEGGIDVVKDDHYLGDQPFCRFEDRVRACTEVVDGVFARTGRRCLYAPHLCGTPTEIVRMARQARAFGAGAVLLSPMLIGVPLFLEVVHELVDVPVLAHPSFGGATRFAEPALLGKFLRLIGSDAVIFPGFGGRFSNPAARCRALSENLRKPWAHLKPSFAAPAGGMTVERVDELVRFYGTDSMLLIGGSLLEAGANLPFRTREFVEAVHRAAASTHPVSSL